MDWLDRMNSAMEEPISQPYGLHEAVVADPEGNLIEIVAGIPED